MDLGDQVEEIKSEIFKAYNKRLIRLGIREDEMNPRDKEDGDFRKARAAIEAFIEQGMSYADARDKYLDEVSFTLFNRIAGMKAMESEARKLCPEIIQIRAKFGDRSHAHNTWLDANPKYNNEDLEGLDDFLRDKFEEFSDDLSLYDKDYPFDLMPDV